MSQSPAVPASVLPAGDAYLLFQQEADGDRRVFRRALAVAAAAHLALLAVTLPEVAGRELEPTVSRDVFVNRPVRIKPPVEPRQPVAEPRERRRVPMPAVDPTVDVVPVEVVAPPVELPPLDLALPIPAPPVISEPLADAVPDELMVVGQGVAAPVRVHYVAPRYTELARRARIQGAVILRMIVDREGETHSIEVLKSLPFGLDRAAVDAVDQWRFEPSTFRGRPVDVLYTLTVNFSLQ